MKSVVKSFAIAVFLLGATLVPQSKVLAQATDAKVKAEMRLIDLGNARQAVDDLRKLVAQDGKNAEAHAALAIALLDMNDVNGAAAQASAAYELDRRNVLVRIARGMVFGRQHNVKDALTEFNAAIKQNDKEIGSYLALSRYYLSIDSLKPAEITLYRAQSINDKDVRSYIGLAELYERQKISELAIGQYEQALKIAPGDVTVMANLASMYYRGRRYNESVNEWLKILRVDSTYPDAYYQVGNLYYLAGQYQNAAAYANRYTALMPDDIYGQWLLARSLAESGQYQQALPALEKVSVNDSLKALSQVLMARGYFYGKEYPKAIQIFANAKGLEPKDYTYWGVSLVNTGDTTGAIAQLRQSLVNDTVRNDQEKQAVMQQVASWLYTQKRFEEAGKAFGDIADKYPTEQWNLAAAQTYLAAKRTDLADQYFDRVLKMNPISMPVFYLRAMATMSNLGSDTALTRWSKVIDLATASNSKDTLGTAEGFVAYHYAGKKDWEKTVQYTKKALKDLEGGKSPYIESFATLRAQADLQIKDFDDARSAAEQALKLNPNSKAAKEVVDYLNKVKDAPQKKGK